MHLATASDDLLLHPVHRVPEPELFELWEFCESKLLTKPPELKSSQMAESLTGGDEPLNVNGESLR